jgi:hypothetical protein
VAIVCGSRGNLVAEAGVELHVRASSTCCAARKVVSSSGTWTATRPANFVVMRSSATISEDSAK